MNKKLTPPWRGIVIWVVQSFFLSLAIIAAYFVSSVALSVFNSMPPSDTSARTATATIAIAIVTAILKLGWSVSLGIGKGDDITKVSLVDQTPIEVTMRAATGTVQESTRSVSVTTAKHATQLLAFNEVDQMIAAEMKTITHAHPNSVIISHSHHLSRIGFRYVVTAALLISLRP